MDVSTGRLGCLAKLRQIRVKGSAIKHFGLGDEVSFRLGLSVKAVDCYGTKGHTCNH